MVKVKGNERMKGVRSTHLSVSSEGWHTLTGESPVMVKARAM